MLPAVIVCQMMAAVAATVQEDMMVAEEIPVVEAVEVAVEAVDKLAAAARRVKNGASHFHCLGLGLSLVALLESALRLKQMELNYEPGIQDLCLNRLNYPHCCQRNIACTTLGDGGHVHGSMA